MPYGYGQLDPSTFGPGYGTLDPATFGPGYGQLPANSFGPGYGQLPANSFGPGYGQLDPAIFSSGQPAQPTFVAPSAPAVQTIPPATTQPAASLPPQYTPTDPGTPGIDTSTENWADYWGWSAGGNPVYVSNGAGLGYFADPPAGANPFIDDPVVAVGNGYGVGIGNNGLF